MKPTKKTKKLAEKLWNVGSEKGVTLGLTAKCEWKTRPAPYKRVWYAVAEEVQRMAICNRKGQQ